MPPLNYGTRGLPRRWLSIPVPNPVGPLAFTPDGQTLIVADAIGNGLSAEMVPLVMTRIPT